MKRIILCVFGVLFVVACFAGCMMYGDVMVESEKLNIKMINKATCKLGLNDDQKVQVEQLKLDVHKIFVEGMKEKQEGLAEIRKEQAKENPDSEKLSVLLKGLLKNEIDRINQAFEMTLAFQKNLNDEQKKKFNEVIIDWAKD